MTEIATFVSDFGFGFSFPTVFFAAMSMDVTGPAARLRERDHTIPLSLGVQGRFFSSHPGGYRGDGHGRGGGGIP